MSFFLRRGLTSGALKKIDKNKILLVVGPRRSGKSTLIDELIKEKELRTTVNLKRFNCDVFNTRKMLDNISLADFQKAVERCSLVLIEEAQHLNNLETLFHAISDLKENQNQEQRFIFTMSTFPLRKPRYLTRDKNLFEVFYLSPLSCLEIADAKESTSSDLDFDRIMRFGLYPEIWNASEQEAKELLEELVTQYLYRDLLELESIKKPDSLREILRLLALGIDEPISISKMSQYTGLDDKTVERYINHLIEAFIIFRVRPLNRRDKKEVRVRDKFYFWDLGVRNYLVDNFGYMSNRQNQDALWDNFCIAERLKAKIFKRDLHPGFYWRTHGKQEIDFVEEENTWLVPYKFEWNDMLHVQQLDSETKTPSLFQKLYGIEKQMLVSQSNFLEFLKS